MPDRRYLPRNVAATPECELFMLPGLDAEDDAFFVSGLAVTRLELHDWLLLEKSQFSDDLMGDVLKKTPFFCLFASNDSQVSDEIAAFRSRARAIQVQRLVRSLRLLHQGYIYCPLDFITYSRRGMTNIRNPNLYGRKAYELSPTYFLERADLGTLEGIFNSLTVFDEHRSNLSISFAEDLFNQSYDLALMEEVDRVLLLLGAIDALVGIDNVGQLVKALWPDAAVAQFLRTYRFLRDLVAHGRSTAMADAVECLHEVTRCLLREAIAHVLERPTSSNAVGRPLVARMVSCSATWLGAERLADVATVYIAPGSHFRVS